MSESNCTGCHEYLELSRRQFLGAGGATLVALGAPAWLPRVALAQDDCSSRDIIVSIFLRGASDGMTLCVPHAEGAYYTSRPNIAIAPPDALADPNRATDLDGFFGLAPAMTPLMDAYNAGHLLFVHACGSTDPSRSHFDAQRFMEVGKPADPLLFTGWLGRHLLSSAPLNPAAILRAVGIGYGLQRTLSGSPLALPIPNLDSFGLSGDPLTSAARRAVITDCYELVADPVKAAALTTQSTIDLLNTIDFANYVPGGGAVYPTGSLGLSLKSTAALIRAEVGVEAIAIDVGGWDTHANQGVIAGTMATLMGSLSNALAAFHADMFSGNGVNVTVVVMSEFGRRLLENGALGCDHGHGNAMLVIGNHIAGGRVLANWPGLDPGDLFEGRDLQVTIDFRDILAEIVRHRLGNTDLATVFPGYTPTFRGVTQACKGNLNCDDVLDTADVDPFVSAVLDPAGYQTAFPTCDINRADMNSDGLIDGRDIEGFTNSILNP
jgi:uncharacterized protein (DUF1501 family)